MRLIWTTDPHLDHASDKAREQWIQTIASHGPTSIVISGDISEGDDVVFQLQQLASQFAVPLYFVLGNHDFYRSSIARTRQSVIQLSRRYESLHYLTDESATELVDGSFLVGEDGWGDATEGDFEGSPIRLNDFQMIEDFRDAPLEQWKARLNQLGAESADRLSAKLNAIPRTAKQILIVTHVPPYCEACWYEGKTTDKNWAPFFVCGQLGKMLNRFSEDRPNSQVTVLCGHTHHDGIAKIAPNLVVHTGGAIYGQPDIEGMVTVENDRIDVVHRRNSSAK
ncbi:MAG: metallophosphoesterase [Rubripirellula sp.]